MTNNESDTNGQELHAGHISMYEREWIVTVSGQRIELTYLEYRLLQELLRAKGKVIGRETLLERVWGYGNVGFLETRTVDVHVGRLRRKLGVSGDDIITVRNVGYRMNIAPDWINR